MICPERMSNTVCRCRRKRGDTNVFCTNGSVVLGLGAIDAGLFRIALEKKKKLACILFVISFVFCLMMGYLASRDFTQSFMNWAAEAVNIVGETAFLWGVLILHSAGLAEKPEQPEE